MKKIFLAILPALLFAACKRMPIKTETRVYELTFIDGKTEIYTFNNVDVNAYEGIGNNRGGYYFIYIHLKHMSMYRLLSDIKE